MATRAPVHSATPLDMLLASVPDLSRPILARLTARLIERLDEMDGDSDDEPEQDRCDAGDDEMAGGVAPAYRGWSTPLASDDSDAEPRHCAVFDRDQSPRPAARYGVPRRRAKPPTDIANVGPLVPIIRTIGHSTWRFDAV